MHLDIAPEGMGLHLLDIQQRVGDLICIDTFLVNRFDFTQVFFQDLQVFLALFGRRIQGPVRFYQEFIVRGTDIPVGINTVIDDVDTQFLTGAANVRMFVPISVTPSEAITFLLFPIQKHSHPICGIFYQSCRHLSTGRQYKCRHSAECLQNMVTEESLLFFRCFQESCTDHRVNDTGDECSEADI